MEKNTFELIYEQVRKIPEGKVASYGQIAALAGNKKWSRVVGYALHGNPDPATIPCHRVVTKDGKLSLAFAFGGYEEQARRLEREGVHCEGDHVDMEIYQWETPWIEL